VRPRLPLSAEIFAARAAGRLSRLARVGGGTTVPGKLLWKLDPGAVDRLAARLPQGSALISATNGKTTTAAMVAEILGPRVRLAHNRSGANLVSGIASTLLETNGAELGLFEVDEGALPEVARRLRPRAVCLGNLFRDQLDRYGELELVAERWRRAVRELDPAATLVVNADDPQVGDLARERTGSVVFGVDDPSVARPALEHAADSKYCVACGTPYAYAAAYVGHLGDYRCPSCGHARPGLDVAGRAIELAGLERASFELVTASGTRRVDLRLPGLYNVYNALAAASLATALGAGLDEVVSGLERFGAAFGRFERIAIGDRRLLMLLIKNPAGANEAVRTLVAGGGAPLALLALNDAIADGRDVSWIWDVDFEPLLPGLERLIASGDRAAELALRFKYGGLAEAAIEVEPDLERALDRALELTPADGELAVLPTYTAMLALRAIVAGRGYVRPYWEAPPPPGRGRERLEPPPTKDGRRP
jgi:UDP-N-acetylmuramyl tripeptide synthase